MTKKRFYVTIEVTGEIDKDIQKMTDSEKRDLYGSIVGYVRGEKSKKNYPGATNYLHSENVLSVYDEKGNEL